jgi:hypothetical protein
MTDDVTRGLAMLADEVEPAHIDAHDVITRARARTRNRRATFAAGAATFAVAGALVATMIHARPAKPATVTPPRETLSARLDRLLVDAVREVAPDDWTPVTEPAADNPPLTFLCGIAIVATTTENAEGCVAHGTFVDKTGPFDVQWSVDKAARNPDEGCAEQCTQWGTPVRTDLSDGTTTQVRTYTEEPTNRDIQQLFATRPDGTRVGMALIWPKGQRSAQPLTTDQLLRWATVFTYDDTLPVGKDANPPSTPFVSDDPNRADRINQQLADVLAKAIPAGWTRDDSGAEPDEPPFTFGCGESTYPATKEHPRQTTAEDCWTYGYYQDGAGKVGIKFSVSRQPLWFTEICRDVDCAEKTLRDGTKVRVKTNTTHADPVGEYQHEIAAKRKDGTYIWVATFWTGKRATTPLTDEELLKFATAFTF